MTPTGEPTPQPVAATQVDNRNDAPQSSPPAKKRRWPWIVGGSLLGLLAVASLGASAYYSQLLGDEIVVNKGKPRVYTIEVLGVEGAQVTYQETGDGSGSWDDVDYMAFAEEGGGWTQSDQPRGTDPATRRLGVNSAAPALAAGQKARLDGYFFYQDPKAGMGLDFQEVTYDSPLGPMSAWVVPGAPDQDTWVIYTHGLGATRAEGLRQLSIVQPLGYPMMLITYRNDTGEAQTDGQANFGSEEWQDLEGAVQYALDNGAKNVFLSGTSHGGAVTLGFMVNSPLSENVTGIFLDSPASDFGKIVEMTADGMGVPGFITDVAMTLSSRQYGLDWAGVDYQKRAAEFDVPMTIVQGTGDKTVPAEVNIEFSEAVNEATDGLADLHLFEGVAHTTIWNADRQAYTDLLTGALEKAQ